MTVFLLSKKRPWEEFTENWWKKPNWRSPGQEDPCKDYPGHYKISDGLQDDGKIARKTKHDRFFVYFGNFKNTKVNIVGVY